MNNKPKSSKKGIVIIVIVIILVLIAYFYYEGGSATSSSSLQTTAASADAEQVGAQVLSLLNQIKSLRIDTTLFTDPAYQTLRDYSIAIPQENVGRVNPFAPIPGMPTTQSTRSTGANSIVH